MENLAGIKFSKGHGAGNDFVFIEDVNAEIDLSKDEIAYLCDRHRGIGADGLIKAVKAKAEVDADWFMDYYNGDGTVAEMCGNGARAYAKFLEHVGLFTPEKNKPFNIDTRAGLKQVIKIEDDIYSVDLGPWKLAHDNEANEGGIDSMVKIEGIEEPRGALSIDMGNPHTVVAVQSLAELKAANLTVMPDVQPIPKNGTNVELITADGHVMDEGHGKISMRVFERGVGETLACGTGIGAAAAATRFWIGEDAPHLWEVHVPGGVLNVEFIKDDKGNECTILMGPAIIVSDGTLV
ncbi:MAG: diaminopimelate epimerase [Micrococcaceae bacterium]